MFVNALIFPKKMVKKNPSPSIELMLLPLENQITSASHESNVDSKEIIEKLYKENVSILFSVPFSLVTRRKHLAKLMFDSQIDTENLSNDLTAEHSN